MNIYVFHTHIHSMISKDITINTSDPGSTVSTEISNYIGKFPF